MTEGREPEMDESLITQHHRREGSQSADAEQLLNGRESKAQPATRARRALAVQSGVGTITGKGDEFDPKDIEGGETGRQWPADC